MAVAAYVERNAVQEILSRDDERVGGNASSIEEEKLDLAIRDAQSEIDAKLSGQYVTPFDPVPPLVRDLTMNIAAYLVHLNFRENRELTSDLNPLYLRYQRAQELLQQLQNGSAEIPPPEPDPDDPPSRGAVLASKLSRPALVYPSEFDLNPRYIYGRGRADYTTPEHWGQF